MKILGGATTLDSFLKVYKAIETEFFYPYEWFGSPDKLDCTELPPYETIFSKPRNRNPLEKDFNGYQKLVNGGLDLQGALKNYVFKQFHQQVLKITLIWKKSASNTAWLLSKIFLR